MACILLSRLDGAASFDTKPDPTQHENLTQPQIQPDLTRCIFLVGVGQWAKKICLSAKLQPVRSQKNSMFFFQHDTWCLFESYNKY